MTKDKGRVMHTKCWFGFHSWEYFKGTYTQIQSTGYIACGSPFVTPVVDPMANYHEMITEDVVDYRVCQECNRHESNIIGGRWRKAYDWNDKWLGLSADSPQGYSYCKKINKHTTKEAVT